MYCWERHKLRIVADSDAAFVLFQPLLIAGGTLERREPGRTAVTPSAPPAGDRKCR
jgi:hypothetical protein